MKSQYFLRSNVIILVGAIVSSKSCHFLVLLPTEVCASPVWTFVMEVLCFFNGGFGLSFISTQQGTGVGTSCFGKFLLREGSGVQEECAWRGLLPLLALLLLFNPNPPAKVKLLFSALPEFGTGAGKLATCTVGGSSAT